MFEELIELGQAQANYNAAGTRILKYTVEMYHNGLNEHKLISAPDLDMLQNKVNLQGQKWIDKWEILESKRKAKEDKEANIDNASQRNQEAKEALNQKKKKKSRNMKINSMKQYQIGKKIELRLKIITNRLMKLSKRKL